MAQQPSHCGRVARSLFKFATLSPEELRNCNASTVFADHFKMVTAPARLTAVGVLTNVCILFRLT